MDRLSGHKNPSPAARDASAGRFIESRARKVIADIYALANSETLPNSTCRAFLKAWLDRKSFEADDATHERYTGCPWLLRPGLSSGSSSALTDRVLHPACKHNPSLVIRSRL
jgi:hypothetical protein